VYFLNPAIAKRGIIAYIHPMHLNQLRELTVDAPLPSGHAFLSAASCMVLRGSMLYVVADDANCLAVFDLDADAPGWLIPLITDDLPRDAAARKRLKPDFEILLALPDTNLSNAQVTRLLALGSGSTAQRMRGAIAEFSGLRGSASLKNSKVRLIDLQPMFAAIAPLVPQVNLEGAVLREDDLLLFNRGTMTHPASHIFAVPLAGVLAGEQLTAKLCATMTLPICGGVPLTVTDACLLENGHILLSAVAEATADNYTDGALTGAAIVELDSDFIVRAVEPIDPILKIEGLSARVEADGVQLFCVTDADDPLQPAGVYEGVLSVLGRLAP
jgi:hypothetical protein